MLSNIGLVGLDLNYFEQIIIKERKKIISDLQRHREAGEELDTSHFPSNMAENGTDAMEKEKSFFHVSRDSNLLLSLDEALARIANGTYGICVKCHKPIPVERLAVVPHTHFCVECKNGEK